MRYFGPDGVRRPLSSTYRTKQDAEAALGAMLVEMANGHWTQPERRKIKLGVYAAQWIVDRPNLGIRAREGYEALLRNHIAPYLGSREIGQLSASEVRSWRSERLASGVGTSTMAKAYRLLKAVMATAVDDGLVSRNPCRIRGAGEERPPERPVLSVEQVWSLAEAIEPRYRVLVLLATYGSLRWGELWALRVEDVDLSAMTVSVSRSVTQGKSEMVVKAPKTAAGLRVVALPVQLRDDLRHHVAFFAERTGERRLFVSEKGHTLQRSSFTRIWRRAKAEAGVDGGVHFHDLRHTGNHFAAATGVSTRDLMARMGHSSMRAALIYQHASMEGDRRIATALGTLIPPSAR